MSALRRALVAAQVRADHAESGSRQSGRASLDLAARNALLALQNEKMRRELYGQRSERTETAAITCNRCMRVTTLSVERLVQRLVRTGAGDGNTGCNILAAAIKAPCRP